MTISVRNASAADAGAIAGLMTQLGYPSTAEQVARGWGCQTVEVTSSRERAGAQAFYRRMGYDDWCGRSARFLKPLPPGPSHRNPPDARRTQGQQPHP